MLKAKTNRGFASLTPERRREIASRGGAAAHAKGKAHEFTQEEARVAGRKGGLVVSVNKRHMSEIGRKGAAVAHAPQAEIVAGTDYEPVTVVDYEEEEEEETAAS